MKSQRTPRVLLPEGEVLSDPGTFALDPAESAHLWGPLRRRNGDSVIVVDGCGGWGTGVVGAATKRRCEVLIDEIHRDSPETTGLRIALSVLHSRAMDWAVQKCVELGVSAFHPVIAERSQLGRDAAQRRVAHWERVALQALKQCHRTWAMQIEAPRSLAELVEGRQGEVNLVASQGGESPPQIGIGRDAMLLVGPEGGLNEPEQRLVQSEGWRAVSLGKHVLRADTAAVVGAAMLLLTQGSALREQERSQKLR